jgi:predicted ABC-type ATPase
MKRPVVFVLAGVNGAGKSSVGGHLLEREGLTWFNPDAFARELVSATGCDQNRANARHIARVRLRVSQGGHDIPDATIRARYPRALRNLIDLMPHLARLQVYDNSTDAAVADSVPDPTLVLDMKAGRLTWPAADDAEALRGTPLWARPVVETALPDQ